METARSLQIEECVMKLWLSASAAMLIFSQAANAESLLPTYQVQERCRALAVAIGSASDLTVASCILREQGIHQELRRRWPVTSHAIKHYCVSRTARIDPSYDVLKACLDEAVRFTTQW